jgi:hypothetical protein
MPIRKFRSVGEMNQEDWLSPNDPRLARSIRTCWEMASRLSPITFPPGVYKHRSIQALNRQSEEWERAAFRNPSAG